MDQNLPSPNPLAVGDASTERTALRAIVDDLFPICRSITGDGVRQSLTRLAVEVPLEVFEVPTGTPVFDWTVPKEWNVRDAFIANSRGERLVDFRRHSLHVVSYSVPVRRRMRLAELRPHLFTRPDLPDLIPYRTSYYGETWGFCLPHRQLESLPDDDYDVVIDSTLEPGHLTYGEYVVHGSSEQEVLFSSHCCHPSLCNDNLSGMAVAARLAARLTGRPLRYTYRFLWMPGTIGAITWLARHEPLLPLVRHGLVLSCIGDPGRFTYKRSRRGTADIDRIVEHVLMQAGGVEVRDFVPMGYDERQFCSPGINLPVGCFMRTPNGEYPEYHTSGDNLGLVTDVALNESLDRLTDVVAAIESNRRYLNLAPKGEPQLGRRGLYRTIGGTENAGLEGPMLWVLNFSDGEASLLDIAERSGLSMLTLARSADLLIRHELLRPLD